MRNTKAQAKKVVTATKATKRDFDAAHKAGMAALKSGGYVSLGDAIKREREAIDALPRRRIGRPRSDELRWQCHRLLTISGGNVLRRLQGVPAFANDVP